MRRLEDYLLAAGYCFFFFIILSFDEAPKRPKVFLGLEGSFAAVRLREGKSGLQMYLTAYGRVIVKPNSHV